VSTCTPFFSKAARRVRAIHIVRSDNQDEVRQDKLARSSR